MFERFIKAIAIYTVIALKIPLASGQQSLFNGTSSAGIVADTIKFNCDFINPTGLPGFAVSMKYKTQSQSQFSEIIMNPITGDPHYAITNECGLYFASNPGSLQYYFRAGNDSVVATQSSLYTGTGFPPRGYFADFAVDPANDTLPGTRGPWLDLIGSGMTYSSSRLYGYLSNVSGTWPANNWDTLYLYAIGMIDPGGNSTTLFAMVYINLFPILNPGLYKINLVDTSFTRIGNVSYSISGGLLYLSCAIADLENDPDWSSWPPENGYVITAGATFTGTLTSPTINDFTYPAFYEPRSQNLSFSQNHSPQLFGEQLDLIPGVSVRARIGYYDSDGHLPVTRRLYFDRGIYDMGSYDHVYSDSSEFEYILPWPGTGMHYYFFKFSDGRDTFTTAMDSIYLSGTEIEAAEMKPNATSLLHCYPNPFNNAVAIEFYFVYGSKPSLCIYDLNGRLVKEYSELEMSADIQRLIWDGTDNHGEAVKSGIYFALLKGTKNSPSAKLILLK